jgi:hypothetical protein
MVDHDTGVNTVDTYAVKRVDSDYFSEESTSPRHATRVPAPVYRATRGSVRSFRSGVRIPAIVNTEIAAS